MKDNDSFRNIPLNWFGEDDDDDDGKPKDGDGKGSDEKKFTQKEVNALIEKGTDKERTKLLKELGVESVDDIKAALKKVEEAEAAKKATDEKPKDGDKPKEKSPEIDAMEKRLEAMEKENKEFQASNRRKDLRALALKLGADEETVDDVVKLVADEKDFGEDEMKEFLNKRKYFLKKGGVGDFGGKSGDKGSEKTEENVKARLAKAMGLKEDKK